MNNSHDAADARRTLEKLAGPGGSLEVRGDVTERWRASLASAASPAPPAGSEHLGILEQLLPIEVHLLEWMHEQKVELAPYDYTWQDVTCAELLRYFGLSQDEYVLLASHLHRLELVDGRGKPLAGDAISQYATIGLTSLGLDFLRRCRAR